MEAKLRAVMTQVKPISEKVDKLPPRLEHFISRITVRIWRHAIGKVQSLSLNDFSSEGKALAYEAGVLGEDYFRQLCKLDDFHGEDIRPLRKQSVLEIKEGIRRTDVIRSSALRWLQFAERSTKRFAVAAARRERAAREAAEKAEVARKQKEEEQRKKDEEAKKQRKQRMEEEAQFQIEVEQRAEADRQRQQRLNPPARHPVRRWRPEIVTREFPQGAQVYVELPGVHSDDIHIETQGRTISISGVRGQDQFSEVLTVAKKFDVDHVMLQLEESGLVISLPYSRLHLEERHRRAFL